MHGAMDAARKETAEVLIHSMDWLRTGGGEWSHSDCAVRVETRAGFQSVLRSEACLKLHITCWVSPRVCFTRAILRS
jgi:hypothetical protein